MLYTVHSLTLHDLLPHRIVLGFLPVLIALSAIISGIRIVAVLAIGPDQAIGLAERAIRKRV